MESSIQQEARGFFEITTSHGNTLKLFLEEVYLRHELTFGASLSRFLAVLLTT